MQIVFCFNTIVSSISLPPQIDVPTSMARTSAPPTPAELAAQLHLAQQMQQLGLPVPVSFAGELTFSPHFIDGDAKYQLLTES